MGKLLGAGIGFILFIVGVYFYREIGLMEALMYTGGLAGAIIIVYIAATTLANRPSKKAFYFRGGITPEKAKYIAMKFLEEHHQTSLFIVDGGDEDPRSTRYLIPVLSERCYPAEGEEAWAIKAVVHQARFFNGLPTKVLIYVDGGGMISNDLIMNAETGYNDRLWKNPNLHYRDVVPKTPRPRSMREIMKAKLEEAGEIPDGFGSMVMRDEMNDE